MTKVVDIRKADDPRDAIFRAVQLLTDGKLVAFPADTTYFVAASALSPEGIARLEKLMACRATACVAGHQDSGSDGLRAEYAGRRPQADALLARAGHLISRSMRKRDCSASRGDAASTSRATNRFACPCPSVRTQLAEAIAAPIVATPEVLNGTGPATTAEEVLSDWDEVDLIINDGPSRYGDVDGRACHHENGVTSQESL
jgi:tRNA A37 threonylcarbamoyladenosine synthetase subunit TsaC/SUA5/YrdC